MPPIVFSPICGISFGLKNFYDPIVCQDFFCHGKNLNFLLDENIISLHSCFTFYQTNIRR